MNHLNLKTKYQVPNTQHQKMLISILMLVLVQFPIKAQTLLYPGDLAFVAVNADGNKSFSFFCLRDLEAGTEIHFTDNAWMSSTREFRDGEGVLTYTAPTIISAGQIITCPINDDSENFVESGSFNPSGSGDNIIAFQGSLDDPFFIAGIGWARGSSVWDYDEVSANSRSDEPPGLSAGDGTVVALGTADNYVYVGIRYSVLGTRGELLSELADPSNFSSSNSEELYVSDERIEIRAYGLRLRSKDEGGSGEVEVWESVGWGDGVPDRYSDVEVAGMVQVGGDVSVHDLIIEAGGLVEVMPGGKLTVKGCLTNLAGTDGLIIHANETGSGALYNATENVEGTVEVYLSPDQWHFVSTPVTTTQTFEEIFGTPGSHLYGVYEFDESGNAWANPQSPFPIPAHGYNVKYNNTSRTINFVGLLNSFRSRRLFSLSRGAGEGWNLIGNPFPAPMAWKKNSKSNGLEHETIYITTGGSAEQTSWDTYNGVSGIGVPNNEVGNVALGQGFWVKAAEDGAEVGVNSYCETKNESVFKLGSSVHSASPGSSPGMTRGSQAAVNELIRVELSTEAVSEQIVIAFDEEAYISLDQYDSKNMNPNGFGAVVESENLIIASFPIPQSQIPIPIEINIPYDGTLKLNNPTFFSYTSIQLEDRLLGTRYDLEKDSVLVTHAEGTASFPCRYALVIEKEDAVDWVTGFEKVPIREEDPLIYYIDMGGRKYIELPKATAGIYIKVKQYRDFTDYEKVFYNGR